MLAWIVFHDIGAMYRDLKNQETLQELLTIQNLKSLASFLSPQPYQLKEPSLTVKLQAVPPNLKDIQPRPSQLWNCNNIEFG